MPTLPVAGAGVPPPGCRGSPGACSVAAAWPPSPCTPAPPKQTTSVVRIHDILVRIRNRGSIPLTSGSGACYFVCDLQDVNKKLFKFFSFYFLKIHFHNCSKITSHKEVTKQYVSMFFLLFLLDDRRIQIWIHISD